MDGGLAAGVKGWRTGRLPQHARPPAHLAALPHEWEGTNPKCSSLCIPCVPKGSDYSMPGRMHISLPFPAHMHQRGYRVW